MRFEVPQFIEMEDKIFGPLSFKEFAYLIGGGGLCYIIYRFLPTFPALLIMLPVGGFAVALAFYRPNNKPFIEMVEAAIYWFFNGKLYVWKKRDEVVVKMIRPKNNEPLLNIPKTSAGSLTSLSFTLDTQSGKKEDEEDISNDLNLKI
jgi:hypothetical protein